MKCELSVQDTCNYVLAAIVSYQKDYIVGHDLVQAPFPHEKMSEEASLTASGVRALEAPFDFPSR